MAVRLAHAVFVLVAAPIAYVCREVLKIPAAEVCWRVVSPPALVAVKMIRRLKAEYLQSYLTHGLSLKMAR